MKNLFTEQPRRDCPLLTVQAFDLQRVRGNSYTRDRIEPAYMIRPCSKNCRRKIAQNSIEVDAKTKESTRKTEEKLDGRNEEGHERKKPK